ncbi:MAG: hypothetical protein GY798_09245 [Hyphomicrobiales bacterium]|nr:hypothetical protein [Hyphomicrobiales bacterium]
MRPATIAFIAMTLMAVPAKAEEGHVFDALKLEVNAWELITDTLYYVAINNPDEKPKALARYQDDAADFDKHLGALQAALDDSDKAEMLDAIANDWQALKEMTDALVADAESNSGGALFDEKLRAIWEKTIVLEDQIEILAEAVRG